MNEPETENMATEENVSGDAPETSAEGVTAEGEAGAAVARNPEMKWYVATTYSGFENKVKMALVERIRQHHAEEKFGEILIPSESVTEQTKAGKTRVKSKTSFPGYVFVEMLMNENTWHLVKD